MNAITDLNLEGIASILIAISKSAADPHELAEATFLEIARFAEPDIFELGLFQSNVYRSLMRVVDGSRVDNQELDLENRDPDLLTWILESGQTVLYADISAEKEDLPAGSLLTQPEMPTSGLIVPLRFGDRVIGVLSLHSHEVAAFTQVHRDFVSILASSIAPALATSGLAGEIEFLTLQMLLIQEVSRLLMTLAPLPERMNRIVALLSQVLEIERIALYELVDGEAQLRAHTSGPTGVPEGVPELVQRTLSTGSMQSTTKNIDPEDAQHQGSIEAEFAFPLNIVHHRMGALHLCCSGGRSFKEEQIRVLETVSQQLAFAILEARNYTQHQQEAWITTVLLEVARHAAQPGDPVAALQAVLQLATLLVGTEWILLMTPGSGSGLLQTVTSAGLKRQQTFALAEFEIDPDVLGVRMPFRENDEPILVELPAPMNEILQDDRALGLVLSDGQELLGLILTENEEVTGKQPSLITGIAHQISLRLENSRLIEKAALRRSLERELAMAREIQVSFLPAGIPEVPDWELGVAWQVAREVGGDFYDFILLPPGENGDRIGIAIADVADKGVPAALYMALSRTLLRTLAFEILDPAACLERVNKQLIEDTRADLFVSVFYGVWEPEIGQMRFANAGHNPPLIFTPRQRGELLREHGMVLGVHRESTYVTQSVQIDREQLLVLYTDGVTEAMDTNGDFFGIQRLESLVLGLSDWQAQLVADSIQERVLQFTGRRDLFDDMTAIALHR